MLRNNELYHYGVKGMKWGVRRSQKEKYGVSKKQVKKQIKNAKRNYRRNEDPYHTFKGFTGKNWADVYSKHRDAVDKDDTIRTLRDKRDSSYRKASSYYNKSKYDLSDIHQNLGDMYQNKISTRKKEIGKRFTDEYSTALLKDIGYDNVSKGHEMLKAYGITNDRGKYK